MPYPESALLPISALQHLLYCERQCALIHLERQWAENRFTAEGAILHRRAHGGKSEKRRETRTSRAVAVRSLELGLSGVADIVRREAGPGAGVVPVEYKRGRPKSGDCDRIQLCAQALCLEEMLGVAIPAGEIFYGKLRRRTRVEFSPDLRRATCEAAERLHRLLDAGATPPAEPGPKCDRCSLLDLCLPRLAQSRRPASARFDHLLESILRPSPGDPRP